MTLRAGAMTQAPWPLASFHGAISRAAAEAIPTAINAIKSRRNAHTGDPPQSARSRARPELNPPRRSAALAAPTDQRRAARLHAGQQHAGVRAVRDGYDDVLGGERGSGRHSGICGPPCPSPSCPHPLRASTPPSSLRAPARKKRQGLAGTPGQYERRDVAPRALLITGTQHQRPPRRRSGILANESEGAWEAAPCKYRSILCTIPDMSDKGRTERLGSLSRVPTLAAIDHRSRPNEQGEDSRLMSLALE